MRIRDLGDLGGGAILFGGPVSNLRALDALFGAAAAFGAPPSRMICTGDVVAYCGDPAGCVDHVRAAGVPVIAGNVEENLAAGSDGCGCGFAEGSACDRLAAGWWAYVDARIGAADRAWMAALPSRLLFTAFGRRYAVIHGGAAKTSRFLWRTASDADLAAEIAALERDHGPLHGVVAGHSGQAFVRAVGDRLWINAGNVGMPPNDGRPQTEYVTLGSDGPRLRRLSYDYEAAAWRMEAAGLRQGYETCLRDGWWPSEDVLPPELRRRRA